MPLALCPQCDHEFIVPGSPRLGQPIVCPACQTPLRVVWLDPCELDWRNDTQPPRPAKPADADGPAGAPDVQ